MSIAVLEFEKPLAELEDQIDALMRMDAAGSGNHSKELRSLRRRASMRSSSSARGFSNSRTAMDIGIVSFMFGRTKNRDHLISTVVSSGTRSYSSFTSSFDILK